MLSDMVKASSRETKTMSESLALGGVQPELVSSLEMPQSIQEAAPLGPALLFGVAKGGRRGEGD